MAAINLLRKEVYELIAAGEVIERPASVIKELLENAVDAGATAITVEIKNGGRTFMRVTDNGCGIAYEDVPTAFLRHATSKVSEKADLDSISTLGFRGEALASICAVAKVEILTKQHDSPLGTKYAVYGSEQKEYETAGCPQGTSIIIRDLFFNVPARLKFLKKDATEANRIQDLMGRLAVSHPEISVKLIRDNKTVIVTAGDGKLYSAIYAVFGRDFANSLIEVDYKSEGISVYGYVSKPLMSRTNRKMQVFYVNDRYVRSEVCSQALEEAYRNSIMVGKFPVCVLKVNLPPEMIDVNVHPSKTEVRFSDVRFVYDAVYFAVKQALTEKDRPTQLKIENKTYYDKNKLFVQPEQPKPKQMVFAENNTSPPKKTSDDSGDDLFLKSLESPDTWNGMLEPVPPKEPHITASTESGDLRDKLAEKAPSAPLEDGFSDEDFLQLCSEYAEQTAKDIRNETAYDNDSGGDTDVGTVSEDSAYDESFDSEDFQFVKAEDFEKKPTATVVEEDTVSEPEEKPVVIGELFKTYIVAQCGNDMLLIDKHAAHERFIFENIKNDSRNLSAQILLEPIMITLSYDEFDALAANIDKTEKLGFIIEPDVAPTVAVKGLPMLLREENPTDIIVEIAQKLIMNERDPAPDFYDDLYHSMACKAAIKAHDESKTEELQKLVDSVYGREDIRYCPHGRPVMITMPKREIEKQFKRIV